jgi:hypothetical protein
VPEDRISRLSQRFRTHGVGRKPTSTRARERHSFYLDGELVERLDKIYRELNHQLYPRNLSKSTFLETLLEYSLNHLAEVRSVLSSSGELSDDSEQS